MFVDYKHVSQETARRNAPFQLPAEPRWSLITAAALHLQEAAVFGNRKEAENSPFLTRGSGVVARGNPQENPRTLDEPK